MSDTTIIMQVAVLLFSVPATIVVLSVAGAAVCAAQALWRGIQGGAR